MFLAPPMPRAGVTCDRATAGGPSRLSARPATTPSGLRGGTNLRPCRATARDPRRLDTRAGSPPFPPHGRRVRRTGRPGRRPPRGARTPSPAALDQPGIQLLTRLRRAAPQGFRHRSDGGRRGGRLAVDRGRRRAALQARAGCREPEADRDHDADRHRLRRRRGSEAAHHDRQGRDAGRALPAAGGPLEYSDHDDPDGHPDADEGHHGRRDPGRQQGQGRRHLR